MNSPWWLLFVGIVSGLISGGLVIAYYSATSKKGKRRLSRGGRIGTVGGGGDKSQANYPINTPPLTSEQIEYKKPSGGEISVEVSDKSFKYNGTIVGLLVFGLIALVGVLVYALVLKERNEPPKQNQPTIIINLNEVRERLDKGVEEKQYRIQTFPNNEVIQGKIGSYYIIDLKDAESKELILFEAGRYTKDEFDRAFINSMSTVKKDILDLLFSEKVPFQLYVRGRADMAGDKNLFIDRLIEGTSLEIVYLPKMPDNPNRFLNTPVSQVITKEYNNRQLPNLRAVYIKEKLKVVGLDSTILEGEVTSREDKIDRNALILLYWPK